MKLPSGLSLNIKPLKLSEIPPEDKLLQAGHELIEASLKWPFLKAYVKGTVKGYKHPKGGDDDQFWFCRVSEHAPAEATFEEFWHGLGVKKGEHEKQFVHTIDEVTEIKRLSPNAVIVNMHYHFSPPISDRTFTVLQVTSLDAASPKKSGIIVSIPIDLSSEPELQKLEGGGARGLYCAVEQVKELDNGNCEWRMAVESTPGGSIPDFIAQGSLPGQVCNDVPFFIRWLHSDRKNFFNDAPKPVEEPTPPVTAPEAQPHQSVM